MKKFFKELYPYVIIVIVVVLFRTFIATPVRVNGDSMNSTLSDGDILILNNLFFIMIPDHVSAHDNIKAVIFIRKA